MTNPGFDKHLYILRFDHCLSSQREAFGSTGVLSATQIAQILAAKQVIYDAFKAAVATGVPKDRAAIIIDEQSGGAIIRDSLAHGYLTACAVERSGQPVFDFEYGNGFRRQIEALSPTFCKALVGYNPEGSRLLNRRQVSRLRRLSDYLHEHSRSLFLLQLLVPPGNSQIEWANGDRIAFEMDLRPKLIAQAIDELQSAHVEPDVWMVEGLERRSDYEKIAAVAARGGRKKVGCVVLGCAEDETKLRRWLKAAAPVRGFTGFAVGQTIYRDPLEALRQGTITRQEAVAAIARRYRRLVDIFAGKLSKTASTGERVLCRLESQRITAALA